MSRITDEKLKQYFGNGQNSFYVELRCNLPCVIESDTCNKCQTKTAPYKYQGSRRYDHGKINEAIPDHSHIFGSKWYESRIVLWGQPSSSTIRIALEYQKEARNGFIVYQNSLSDTYKENVHSEDQDMPRGRKPKTDVDVSGSFEAAPVHKKKQRVATVTNVATSTNESVEQNIIDTVTPVKQSRKRKPVVANEIKEGDEAVPKKRTVAARKKTSPVQKQVVTTNPLLTGENVVHQDAVIPTFMEEDIEQVDTDGYEIEYVELREFELNGITYFRDYKKDKLYKKVKGCIGPYMGRYCRDIDEIDSTVPDSDDETEY